MNVNNVKQELQDKYPNKSVLVSDGEIICEVKPASIDPNESIAVAVIDKTVPHYHKVTTEIYEVIEGELSLFVDEVEHKLKEGESFTIKPNQKHYAIGNETWIKCPSHPAWTMEDHILVKNNG